MKAQHIDFGSVEVLPKYYFYCQDGRIIKNPIELVDLLKVISKSTFYHHVNPTRNDFFNWLVDVFEITDIAELINTTKDRDEMIKILEDYFSLEDKTKKDNIVKFSIKKEDPANNEPIRNKPVSKDSKTQTEKKEQDQSRKKVVQPPQINKTSEPLQSIKKKKIEIKTLEKPRLEADKNTEQIQNQLIESFDKLYQKTSELRKMGVDTKYVELMLMRVGPKIKIFSVTSDQKDAQKVNKMLTEISEEINELIKNTNV